MNQIYKVVLFYNGKEYTEYVDTTNGRIAINKAKASFKKKHKLKVLDASIDAQAFLLSESPPEVMYPRFFPKGKRPDGRPIMGIKMVRERLKVREYVYSVRWIGFKKPENIQLKVDVTAANEREALVKGARELMGKIPKGKIPHNWIATRIGDA